MSRRRVHEEEDGYERAYKKRRRVSENQEIEDRLESLILRVGEKSTSSLESNLEGLASVLEADLGLFRSKILRILTECAIRMPEKCTIYTTLVGLLNAKNFNFGGEFVDYMVKNFKDALKACKWDVARYSLRFLADLVNCHVLSCGSLMQLFDNMLDTANEDGVPQVRRDWYVYAVLSTLPWVGRELYEKKEQELDHLMVTIEIFLNKRSKKHQPALRVWSSDTPHPQEEYLDCLWAQVRKLRQDNWAEKHIPRPYLAFDSILCEALQHNLPTIMPPPHHESYSYPLPTVVFRMFDYTDCPAEGPLLPGSHAIERFLIEEHLRQIINNCFNERKDCAAQLLNFPYKAKIPLDYCIVEVIFGELFRLPAPKHLEICYGSILIELCKLQPSTMPQVLAQATEILFRRIDSMAATAFDRFVWWFAYHLSNFQFRWSWEDWDSCLQRDPEHPRPKFIREVLLKALRLSYFQRIRDMMPESYAELIPALPEPIYKYTSEGASSLPGTAAAHELVVSIRRKCTLEEVLNVLNTLPGPRENEETNNFNPLKIDVFVQTLLNLGSKSFSHSFAAIGKFHYVFKVLAETEEAQICILRNMYALWKNHYQMIVVLTDKFLKTGIIECSAIANWIFSKEMTPEFTKLYIWEILHLTIRKKNKHVTKLSTELTEAREKLRRAESRSESSSEDDDNNKDRNKEKPSEDVVERMEEKLEAAQADQKNLFLIIFQRFIMILSEHLVRCDTDGIDYNTHWYKWTIGRLQQVFLTHHEQVQKYSSTLETLLFTPDLDPHILDVFHQFVSLRA
ncbi:PREDICTED: nuclear cap-binding protein subunit 1 [Dufourea novaeangliae]|uniref:Nuclear cap-binding protein subunit 1 n=1 Tax=Dufourea novaeangliae TaxID=178035 RepID=A0A154PSU0_DUFNO|nr:PREDICTED: nuclear cap-binding protein subunit 1 [Dufourea novaeangliae]KZC14827.1 Nuclear cap-binding protein subunit 1 [Dufourea novaeangliae]